MTTRNLVRVWGRSPLQPTALPHTQAQTADWQRWRSQGQAGRQAENVAKRPVAYTHAECTTRDFR